MRDCLTAHARRTSWMTYPQPSWMTYTAAIETLRTSPSFGDTQSDLCICNDLINITFLHDLMATDRPIS